MSSQLHQAIQLAQSGQRAEARALLLEFLQTHNDHEAAWLWLAAVASDWDEYERALEAVLRINPQNAVARQKLAEFREQRAATAADPQAADDIPLPPSPVPPTMVGQAAPAPPAEAPPQQPLVVSGVPDPSAPPAAAPPPFGAATGGSAEQAPPSPPPAPPVVERVIERERVVVKHKGRGCLGCGLPVPGCGCGGCGCWQGCLLVLFLVIVLPALACFGLSYGGNSLGILDWPTRYLPGRFGEKTLTVELPPYALELTVPRTWYVADPNDEQWQTWRDVLDGALPFSDAARQWSDLENIPLPVIVEADPIMLALNGDVITLRASPTVQADFTCEAIRRQATPEATVITYEGGLCGLLSHEERPYSGQQVFQQYEPPQRVYQVTWLMPLNAQQGVRWSMTLNTTLWDFYAKRLQTMAESVQVQQNNNVP